jgi:protein-disulfide isomerase
MKDLAVGIVIGLIVGVLVGYIVVGAQNPAPQACEANPPGADFDKTLEKAVEKINSMVHANYPDVNVRVTKTQPYGEIYLLNLEFYNDKGTLTSQSMFMTANGSMLLLNDPRCIISLSEQETNGETGAGGNRINVSVDDDPSIGSEDAKVVIVEFSDYTCPYCAKFANEVEDKLLENYGDKIRFVYRDFPVHGDIAYKGAEAANCAGEQGKYWEFHRILYQNQREWMSNTSMLYSYAEQLGLNVTAFKACLDSGKYKSEVDKDLQDGRSYGVTGTPTFFINGKKVVGYMPYEEFAKLIDQELQ